MADAQKEILQLFANIEDETMQIIEKYFIMACVLCKRIYNFNIYDIN